MRTPNQVDSEGRVIQHYVPMSSTDTPEEMLEHYRQWWSMCIVRTARIRANLPQQINKKTPGYNVWREAYDTEKQAEHDFNLVRMVVESYRFSFGNGTLIPVQGRHGNHANLEMAVRETPLTHPGDVHLFVADKKYNVLCEDDAHGYESAVTTIEHVTCRECLRLYWAGKRKRKRKHQSCA